MKECFLSEGKIFLYFVFKHVLYRETMAIQVEVMLLHMMRITNDTRRPHGAEMAPPLELLSTTTDSALPMLRHAPDLQK